MRPSPAAIAIFLFAGLLAVQPLSAQEQDGLEPLEEELPQVTIVKRGDDTITEFRLRNKLYMVKVTPTHGASYYLVDREGKGQWTRDANAPKLTAPAWVLTSW